MKKVLLILFFVIYSKIYGQQLEYNFANTTATYTELTNPIVTDSAWTLTFGMKMPFQFKYFGQLYDSLRITPNSVSFTPDQADFIAMGQEDYYYDSQLFPVGSEISYLITGSSPNRIIKAQFKNLKANTSDNTSYEYTVNNQIWLYETLNKIEFHFGPNVVNDINKTTFYFGFLDVDNSPYYAISGTVANPTLVRVTNVGTFKGIASHPNDGTVYAFTPYVPSTNVAGVVKPYTFYNSLDAFTFSSASPSKITIFDISGKQISEMRTDADTRFKYDYSALSSGLYLVSINSNNQLYTEKIIVQ